MGICRDFPYSSQGLEAAETHLETVYPIVCMPSEEEIKARFRIEIKIESFCWLKVLRLSRRESWTRDGWGKKLGKFLGSLIMEIFLVCRRTWRSDREH